MKKFISIFLLTLIFLAFSVSAQTIRIDASRLVPKAQLFLTPSTGSFEEKSTFDIPIYVNTLGSRINGLEVRVSYDKDKLEVIKPSSGLSIIGVWVEPPGYDNTRGTASYVGVIPNGIITDSGLVGIITFKAKKSGKSVVSFSSNSKVLINDGLGTEAQLELGRGEYTILPQAPEGVNIYSDTHPFQSDWYNNKNPIFSWDREPGVTGFSFILDDKPATTPENTINIEENTKAFENLDDGLWYFHIKAMKNGVWGAPGHFLVRIDTTPPAEFKPEVSYLLAAVGLTDRALVSFFTTDNLSGIDHYEVGVIDRAQPTTVSPAFIQSESPFQVPYTSESLNVVVRAIDKAHNVRDVSIPLAPPSLIAKFLQDNLVYILLAIIFAGLVGLVVHYLVGHHILRYLRRARDLMRKEEMVNPPLPPQDTAPKNETLNNHTEG